MAKKKTKKPVKTKQITKSDVKKGVKTEEKYERQVRGKVGKRMPVQAKIGLSVKDKVVKQVKKKL